MNAVPSLREIPSAAELIRREMGFGVQDDKPPHIRYHVADDGWWGVQCMVCCRQRAGKPSDRRRRARFLRKHRHCGLF